MGEEGHTYFTAAEVRQRVGRGIIAARDWPEIPAGTMGWIANGHEENGLGYSLWIRWHLRDGRPFRYTRLTKDEFERDTTI